MGIKKINYGTALKEGEFLIKMIGKDTLLYDEFFRYVEIDFEDSEGKDLYIYLSSIDKWKLRASHDEEKDITEDEKIAIKNNIIEGMKALKISPIFD